MNQFAKTNVFRLFGLVGVYRALRRWHQNQAVVLTYHGVVPEIPRGYEYEYRNFVTVRQFESQIRFLLRRYRPLTVTDFFEPGRDIGGGFLITFDDGFRNNLKYAVPVLQKYHLQGCFFVTTGLVNTRQLLWTEAITRRVQRTRKKELLLNWNGSEKVIPIGNPEQREALSGRLRNALKKLPPQMRDEVMAQCREQLSDVSDEITPDDEERYLFMTWDEVRQMIQAGQQVGSHTHTHPMLGTLTDAESRIELQRSRELLEAETGVSCLTFSYPNGEAENFTDFHISQLRELGYRCAFTQIPLFNNESTDRYKLHRVNISLKMPLTLIEAKLCGFVT